MTATFIVGDTREVVASLPDGSVDLVLTSPPFLALRSYLPADHPDKAREIGSEPDPAAFLATMLELTAGWRRVLAPHGSIAVELGDTYSGSGGAGGDYAEGGLRDGQAKFSGSAARSIARTGYGGAADRKDNAARPGQRSTGKTEANGWPMAKSLTLVPELYRVALAYGRHPLTGEPSPAGSWRVRNVVRWVRPNPPVGALGDKFRPATSDLVVAAVAADRWFDLDAVRTEAKEGNPDGLVRGAGTKAQTVGGKIDGKKRDQVVMSHKAGTAGAPPLDWWEIVPKGYEGSHYATFPPELCIRPIEAMCPRRVCRTCGKPSRRETVTEYEGTTVRSARSKAAQTVATGVSQGHYAYAEVNPERTTTTTGWSSCGCPGTDGIQLDGYHTGPGWRPGIVLDPFVGSGTTLQVAHGHGRDAIGIDLDDRNADLALGRLGMFLDVRHHQAGAGPRQGSPQR